MNGVMLGRVASLLSALGFLCVEGDVPVQPDFDPEKFTGKWYPISSVSKEGYPIDTVVGAAVFEFKAKDSLDWSIETPATGKCKKENLSIPQLDQPGKYRTKWDEILHVVETDYKSYYIFHREGKNYKYMVLYARTREASDKVKEKFKKRASSLGFPADKIDPMSLAACAEPKIYVD